MISARRSLHLDGTDHRYSDIRDADIYRVRLEACGGHSAHVFQTPLMVILRVGQAAPVLRSIQLT